MIGRVVSAKLKNTVTVLVERVAMHPLYKKTYIQSKRYLVDDSIGVRVGDIVDIQKCRPVSKNKHWKVTKVLGKSLTEIAQEQMKEKAEEVIAEVMPEDKGEGESEKGKEVKTEETKEVKSPKKRNRKEKKP